MECKGKGKGKDKTSIRKWLDAMGGDDRDAWIAETLAQHEEKGDTIGMKTLLGIWATTLSRDNARYPRARPRASNGPRSRQ